MRILKISLFFALIFIISCDTINLTGFFVSPSATIEERYTESMELNSSNPSDTIIEVLQEDYTIYMCGDIHVTNTADNLAQFIEIAKTDSSAAFSIILGDITDQKGGMEIAYDTIQKHTTEDYILKTIVGNHDLYFNQWEVYKELFGSGIYYFAVQTPTAKDLYIVLDSGSGTLGNKQLQWLEELLSSERTNYRHCIVFSHTNMWAENFSQFPSGLFSIEESAKISNLLSQYNVNYYFNGHVHYRSTTTLNDVEYVTLDEMLDDSERASYVIVNVGETMDYDFYEL